MEEVLKLLGEAQTFYFATVDGNKPRVRPLGFFMEHDHKLYFAIGKHKESYKQLTVNPYTEISATNSKGEWIRIRGKVVFDDREEISHKAFEKEPFLRKLYNEKTGWVLGLMYLEEAEAEIADTKGGFKKINL